SLNHSLPPLIYTLSLHDALPICPDSSPSARPVSCGSLPNSFLSSRTVRCPSCRRTPFRRDGVPLSWLSVSSPSAWQGRCPRRSRSEEHTSELQSRFDLVCSLLLE